MRAAALFLLVLGCAGATASVSAERDADVVTEPDARPTAPGSDGAAPKPPGPGADAGSSAPDLTAGDPGIIPPSRRDGGIPKPPPGSPPCAADSNAGDGNACPYKFIVECNVARDAGPVQTCICVGSLGGKWYCMNARDGGP